MGQKVHPLGFRVNINKNYHSNWFVKPSNYSLLLFQDHLIRESIYNYFELINNSKNKKNLNDLIVITNIYISRKFDQININISIVSLNNEFFEIVHKLQKLLTINLMKLVNNNRNFSNSSKISVTLKESSEINVNAIFIAKCLIIDLENRIPFRRALKNIIGVVQKQKELLGIKIRVSGRLNGIEMARSEWVRKGRIPLQTLIANIEYSNDFAHTKYGLLGIKVWIYKR
uniref:Small ribosomal subunit protein uS3c n=1 Tax=Partenskyella glossopodia TaxID=552666 RepID=A0A140JZP2_9EUKA|nr:30S ribosomal protein S3 [Partenskyella glossopodia]BAU62569.1 30S ribosomal protein S3 [Partenskyella glossopodia]